MNKKAQESTQRMFFNAASILLVLIVFAAAFAGIKNLFIKESDAEAKKQVENLIRHINANIDNIKKSDQIYPIDLDWSKYGISVKDEDKTKLCLERVDIDTKDFCLRKTLKYPVSHVLINPDTKNLLIAWDGEELIISSYT